MSQATDQYKAAVLRLDEARERIKALEAENERLRTQMEAQKDMWLSWEAKRAALEKDAEILDWQQSNSYCLMNLGTSWYSRKDCKSPHRKFNNIRDAAIAAMEAK